MFGLFIKKTELDKLKEKYQKLLDESYRLSHTNRKESDLKAAQANDVLEQIKALEK